MGTWTSVPLLFVAFARNSPLMLRLVQNARSLLFRARDDMSSSLGLLLKQCSETRQVTGKCRVIKQFAPVRLNLANESSKTLSYRTNHLRAISRSLSTVLSPQVEKQTRESTTLLHKEQTLLMVVRFHVFFLSPPLTSLSHNTQHARPHTPVHALVRCVTR